MHAHTGYSVVTGPRTSMVRPHPAVWRLVHGTAVMYIMALVWLLFQTADDARQALKVTDRQTEGCCKYWCKYTCGVSRAILLFAFWGVLVGDGCRGPSPPSCLHAHTAHVYFTCSKHKVWPLQATLPPTNGLRQCHVCGAAAEPCAAAAAP